jgi:hypothetical protein
MESPLSPIQWTTVGFDCRIHHLRASNDRERDANLSRPVRLRVSEAELPWRLELFCAKGGLCRATAGV